jgi:hypothetical protein
MDNIDTIDNILDLVDQISDYEVTEDAFRRRCCTAYDLCNHEITISIPQNLWLQLKNLLISYPPPSP